MAFVHTSKKSGGISVTRQQTRTGMRREVVKERDPDIEKWQAKSKGERTQICLDDMGQALAEEARKRGQEPSHDKITSFLSAVGETADKTK